LNESIGSVGGVVFIRLFFELSGNWEKDIGKKRAVCYLWARYKENPALFEHWRLVHP